MHWFATDNTEGYNPFGTFARSTDGMKLYGTGVGGGAGNNGTLFMLDLATATPTFSVLYSFAGGLMGGYPHGVILVNSGTLYGITTSGGVGGGTVFSLDPSTLEFRHLHSFLDAEGLDPYGLLVQASNGKLYGTTPNNGTLGLGSVYSIDPANNDAFAVVHPFITTSNPADLHPAGGTSRGPLTQGSDGQLYGMTTVFGANNMGAVFALDPVTHVMTVVHAFTGAPTDGDNRPSEGMSTNLVQSTDGNLYGVTELGGASTTYVPQGAGVVFKLTGPLTVEVDPVV